jgi:dTDP-4-dehydrorhamnose 3,5-epimerase
MIEGVKIIPLKRICDERGTIMHMLRNDDAHFQQFGEIYFSTVYPGAIKGWHIHHKMTLNYAVVTGAIKLVLYDARPNSNSCGELMELFLGEQNYSLVTVPPMVWNGFKGIGTIQAVVANCSSIPHSKEEIERLDPFDPSIPYDWAIKHQ